MGHRTNIIEFRQQLSCSRTSCWLLRDLEESSKRRCQLFGKLPSTTQRSFFETVGEGTAACLPLPCASWEEKPQSQSPAQINISSKELSSCERFLHLVCFEPGVRKTMSVIAHSEKKTSKENSDPSLTFLGSDASVEL